MCLCIYKEIKEVLQSRYTLGMLGGRPKHAAYFVGYRGDLLLVLDPHSTFTNPSLNQPFPSIDYMNQVYINLIC